MTFNDRTNVWEYWVPISANEFNSDGFISIDAVVIGNDGGVRNKNTPGKGLETLTLYVNPNGTMPRNVAYVNATGGNNSTGRVNDPTKPYARISAAMQAITAQQGGKADGGIVRLRPGDHVADNGGAWGVETAVTQNEWVTITRDTSAGATQANTRISSRGSGTLSSNWLKVEGITLSSPGSIDAPNNYTWSVWLKDCDIKGGSGDFVFPVGTGWRGPQYYTELVIRDQRRVAGDWGTGGKIARNLVMHATREDNFQAWPFGVNIIVRTQDPSLRNPGCHETRTCEHADVIQGPNATGPEVASMQNWIWYNVVATDIHYQGIFVRSGAISKNNAFVNCMMYRSYIPGGEPQSTTTFVGKYDHLLIWHCSFFGTNTMSKFTVGGYESTTVPSGGFQMQNISIVGCVAERFQSTVSATDKSWVNNSDVEIRNNHWITIPPQWSPHVMAPGIDWTSGNPMVVTVTTNPNAEDLGKPLSGSVLTGRVNPQVVPCDAFGKARPNVASVGVREP
jgi:hypothetical protein